MPADFHRRHVGDTVTALAVQLKQKNEAGVLSVVDVTGKTVKFKMVDQTGTVVIAETDTGVSTEDAINGKVSYAFSAAGVAAAGTYYGYFTVYSSAVFDTFPAIRQDLVIVLYED